jgi:hypothetical protein
MNREVALFNYLKQGMKNRWDVSRHEDNTGPGIPDVSYGLRNVNGWIELKVLDSWPKSDKTPVKIPHLTDWQKRWLARRGMHGGRTWLLVRIHKDYLLINGVWIWEIGSLSKEELRQKASGFWSGSINWDELDNCLAKGY